MVCSMDLLLCLVLSQAFSRIMRSIHSQIPGAGIISVFCLEPCHSSEVGVLRQEEEDKL